MADTTPALSTLDPNLVSSIQSELQQVLTEQYPALDWRRGVLGDLVLQLNAVLTAADRTVIDNLRQSMSLQAINANPALSDPTLVAAVLSNYRIAAGTGSAASGQVTIVVSVLAPLTIPAGATFTSGGLIFATTNPTAVRTDSSQVTSATDRVLTALPGGNFAFTITLTAQTVGSTGMLKRGTALTPDQPPVNFVQAYVSNDFQGGSDVPTNADLVAKLQNGITATAWSNRSTIAAMISAQSQFAGLVGLSIVGFGDPEMFRDQHGLFPISHGGRCDVYARTAQLPFQTQLTKTATLVGYNAQGGIWQFAMAANDAPGFYDFSQINLPTASINNPGYAVTSDVRGYDLTASAIGYAPDIAAANEAVYSRYQTAVVQFLDTDTPINNLTVGTSTQSYTVVARGLPNVATMQDYLGGRQVRSPAGDVLVKAPVPCYVSVNCWFLAKAGVATLDTAAAAQAMAAAVNGVAFGGQLFASTLIDAIASLMPAGTSLSKMDIFGKIRRPDGKYVYIRDPSVISIPNDPANGVTARTTVFYLDPANVAISPATITTPEI